MTMKLDTDQLQREHPRAIDKAKHIGIGLVIGVIIVAVIAFAFWPKSARAGTATINCAGGAPTWDGSTFVLTCPASAGGGGTPIPPTPTPGDPFAGCPTNALKIDGQTGSMDIQTANFGTFGGNIMSVRLVPPATVSGTKVSSWSEYRTAPFLREGVFSTRPCDFSDANALVNGYGQRMRQFSNTVSMRYKLGAPLQFAVGLTAGQSYYINLRNQDQQGNPTCNIANCQMVGTLPK